MTAGNVVVEDFPFASHDGRTLLARIYRSPDTAVGAPAVIDVHPGIWHQLDRKAGRLYDEALAQRGFVVAAIDVRQAPRFRHPASSADVATAVRWVRSSSDPLGVDPSRVGLVGSSSGGHLALLAACRPTAREHAGRPLRWGGDGAVEEEVDASVRCVAALWAPVDPLTRYRFALERIEHGPRELVRHYNGLRHGAEMYFGDEETMGRASVTRLVAAGEASNLPALWVCHPQLDANVPFPMVEALRTTWRAAGGEIAVTVYPGQSHGFGHRPSTATDRFVDELSTFFRKSLC